MITNDDNQTLSMSLKAIAIIGNRIVLEFG